MQVGETGLDGDDLRGRLSAVADCLDAVGRLRPPQQLAEDVCHTLCNRGGYLMAWIGLAEHDEERTVRPLAVGGAENAYLKDARVVWSDTERGQGPTGRAIRGGRTVVQRDFGLDPLAAPWRIAARARGYGSSIAVPLLHEDGTAFGTLNVYAGASSTFTSDEAGLLERLADMLSERLVALGDEEPAD